MDMTALLRAVGGLGVVLGVLAAALWVVRRYDLRLPGRAIGVLDRRLELVETLSIDARRTVALVRRDGYEHVILISPEGHLVLETGVVLTSTEKDADAARLRSTAEAQKSRDQQRAWQHELRATAAKAAFSQIIARATRTCLGAFQFFGSVRAPGDAPTTQHSDPAPGRSRSSAAIPAFSRPGTKRARRRQAREKQSA